MFQAASKAFEDAGVEVSDHGGFVDWRAEGEVRREERTAEAVDCRLREHCRGFFGDEIEEFKIRVGLVDTEAPAFPPSGCISDSNSGGHYETDEFGTRQTYSMIGLCTRSTEQEYVEGETGVKL